MRYWVSLVLLPPEGPESTLLPVFLRGRLSNRSRLILRLSEGTGPTPVILSRLRNRPGLIVLRLPKRAEAGPVVLRRRLWRRMGFALL